LVAEEMDGGLGPQELEVGEGDLSGDLSDLMEDSVEMEEAAQAEGEYAAENVVPALLSVVRFKQHATACQYWVKLENRLPFKIRNIALRFSAYVDDGQYEKPVLFDTEIKSFSELRPTDAQFRDLFFEYTDCKAINFIKVEDAGRCSAGTLTKFSAQSGDCARYVEVQPSEDVCIFIGETNVESGTLLHPCGMVTDDEIQQVFSDYSSAFTAGDADALAALFAENAIIRSLDGEESVTGRDAIHASFANLFESSKLREISLQRKATMRPPGEIAVVQADADVTIKKKFFWSNRESHADTRMRIEKNDGVVQITQLSDPLFF
jgi:uncharacterized protein (TIGR02246 family)